MLLSNLICIQITSPGGTPIRGKNAEMCLQLSRHSISCLPCPFSSGVSHLQLLLSALTLPVLSLICTLPQCVYFSWVLAWFLVDSSIAILHYWKGVIQRKVCKSFVNGPRSPPQESWHLLQLLKVSELPTQLWPLRSCVSGVLGGLLWCKCMEVTFSQENSQIHLCCCWWSWNS